VQAGAGATTIAAGSGMTLNSFNSFLTISGQYVSASVLLYDSASLWWSRMMIRLIIVLAVLLPSAAADAQYSFYPSVPQSPGPSQTLFNDPPYVCTTNFYVSTSGNSRNPGTRAQPWDIISAFNSKNLSAGTCVNIADGNYNITTALDIGGANTISGSSATPGGYVVFRAYQTMDGPHLMLSTGQTTFVVTVDANMKYIWFDGLNIDGQLSSTHTSTACLQASGNNSGTLSDGRSSHHIYATNMILQGCGQAGFQGANTDYTFLLHSTVFNNTWNPTFVLGSGVSIFEPLKLQGYSGTDCNSNPPDCTTRKALAYDSFWCATGSIHAALNVCYTIVVAWNFLYNNYNPQLAGNTSNSDGEGTEFDDWIHSQQSCAGLTPGCPFNGNGLFMGNACYGNGNACFEVNGTCGPGTTPSCSPAGITLIINNSSAYDAWDPQNGGASSYAGFYGLNDMVNQYWINNTAISTNYPHPLFGSCNCNYGFQIFGTANTSGSLYENNVTFSSGQTHGYSFNNTSLTFPTVGTNKNLDQSDPKYTNATPTTPNTNAAPTLGNDDLRLQNTSPAISFGQGSLSLWLQRNPGAIDAGACMASPLPVPVCPIKGDSLP
jgi:hypothetical protein